MSRLFLFNCNGPGARFRAEAFSRFVAGFFHQHQIDEQLASRVKVIQVDRGHVQYLLNAVV